MHMNGAGVFSRLFPLANDGNRTWGLGVWLDAHRSALIFAADKAIDAAAADIAAQRIEAWLRAELPKREKRVASGLSRSLAHALHGQAVGMRQGLEGARRAVEALGISNFEAGEEGAHYDMQRLIERYGKDEEKPHEEVDPRPASDTEAYFVTARKGKDYAVLLGPYETYRDALDKVMLGRELADKHFPRDLAYADVGFGTARMPRESRVMFENEGRTVTRGVVQEVVALYDEAQELHSQVSQKAQGRGYNLPNFLGVLRRTPGQQHYREPAAGSRPDPGPTDAQLEGLAAELKQIIRHYRADLEAGGEAPAASADVDLVVSHEPSVGTTIQTKDRTWNAAIKAMRYPRFVWSGSRGAWYIQHSADKAHPPADLNRIAEQLRKAGATVEVKVERGEVRSVAERVEAAKERAEDRAERFATYSEKAASRSTAAHQRAHEVGKRFELGQPILVGHHSEAGARADQKRIHRSMDKAVKEAGKAEHWEQRAEGVERHAARMEAPAVVNRRLETLATRLRGIERSLAGELAHTDEGRPYTKVPDGEWKERLEAEQTDLTQQIAYWREQLGSAGLRAWGPNDFHIGQAVGRAGIIRAIGDKSVTVIRGSHDQNRYGNTSKGANYWTETITYSRLKPTDKQDPGPPEPFETKGNHPQKALIEAIYQKHPDKDAKFRMGWKHAIALLAPGENVLNLYVLEDLPPEVLTAVAQQLGLDAGAKKAGPHPDAKLIRAIFSAYGSHRGRTPDGRPKITVYQPSQYRALGLTKRSEYEHGQDVVLDEITDEQRETLAGMLKLDVAAIRGGVKGPSDRIGRLLAFAAEEPGHYDSKTIEGEKVNGTWVKAFARVWEKTTEENREKLREVPMSTLVAVITKHLMGG